MAAGVLEGGRRTTAKVYGVHAVELKPGFSATDFERFRREEWRPPGIPGIKVSVLTGDRGRDSGKYVAVYEFDDKARRDRDVPSPNEASPEFQRILERRQVSEAFERWATMVVPTGGPQRSGEYTDWVTIAEQRA